MSFHVARNTCRSVEGETKKVSIESRFWDNRNLIKKMHNTPMPVRQCKKHLAADVTPPYFVSLPWTKAPHQSEEGVSSRYLMLHQAKAWWITSVEWRWFVGIVMKQLRCCTKGNRNKSPKYTWCVLCTSNCVTTVYKMNQLSYLLWNLTDAHNGSLFRGRRPWNPLTSAKVFLKSFLVKWFRDTRHSPIFPSSTKSRLMGYWQLK